MERSRHQRRSGPWRRLSKLVVLIAASSLATLPLFLVSTSRGREAAPRSGLSARSREVVTGASLSTRPHRPASAAGPRTARLARAEPEFDAVPDFPEAPDIAIRPGMTVEEYLKEGGFYDTLPRAEMIPVLDSIPSSWSGLTIPWIATGILLPGFIIFLINTFATPFIDKYLFGETYEIDWSGRSGRLWKIITEGPESVPQKPQFPDWAGGVKNVGMKYEPMEEAPAGEAPAGEAPAAASGAKAEAEVEARAAPGSKEQSPVTEVGEDGRKRTFL